MERKAILNQFKFAITLAYESSQFTKIIKKKRFEQQACEEKGKALRY